MKRLWQNKTVPETSELLNCYKTLPTVSLHKATETLRISKSVSLKFMKNEATIQAEGQENANTRYKVGKDEKLENLFAWYKFAHGKNAPDNGLTLTHKAMKLLQQQDTMILRSLIYDFIIGRTNTI